MTTPTQAWEVLRQADQLYAVPEVDAAITRLAEEIGARLGAQNPIFVCLMNGAVVFFGRLLPRLGFPLEVDYIHATRYGSRLKGGEMEWVAGPYVSFRGRTVVLVDDILDEGATLAAIEARYRHDGAEQVYKVVLVEKERARTVPMVADFVGLKVPDRYVFGYGMDYKGYLRNAPGIYAVKEGTS